MKQPIEQTNDHNLLIKIDTQVARLIDDVAKLGKDYSDRINNLEECKTDKTYMDKVQIDFESRLRVTEKFQENLIGKMSIITIIVASIITLIVGWVQNKI